MKEFLAKAVKSKLFKGIVALIAAALTAWAANGCAYFRDPEVPRSLGVLACKAAALEPYVGDQAEDLVREIDGNRAFDVLTYLLRQGLTPDEVEAAADAFFKCLVKPEPAPSPAPEPTGYTYL